MPPRNCWRSKPPLSCSADEHRHTRHQVQHADIRPPESHRGSSLTMSGDSYLLSSHSRGDQAWQEVRRTRTRRAARLRQQSRPPSPIPLSSSFGTEVTCRNGIIVRPALPDTRSGAACSRTLPAKGRDRRQKDSMYDPLLIRTPVCSCVDRRLKQPKFLPLFPVPQKQKRTPHASLTQSFDQALDRAPLARTFLLYSTSRKVWHHGNPG